MQVISAFVDRGAILASARSVLALDFFLWFSRLMLQARAVCCEKQGRHGWVGKLSDEELVGQCEDMVQKVGCLQKRVVVMHVKSAQRCIAASGWKKLWADDLSL